MLPCSFSLLLFAACGDDGDGGGGLGALPPAAVPPAPVQVSLICRTLTGAGTAVKQDTFGSLPTSVAPPTPGVVGACANPSWDQSVTPPKVTTYSYDGNGRVLSTKHDWGEGPSQPGISSSETTQTFSLTAGKPGEQACGKVLERTNTDANGNTTTSRACTESGFHLARSDAEGRTITYGYDEMGNTTRVTNPNGSFVTFEYYHSCPLGQDGFTQTCPSGSTALGDCPYGDQTVPRSCFVQTQFAGTDPGSGTANTSYRDGLVKVVLKDGMGRPVEMLDNLGGSANGYTAIQTRETRQFDALGQTTSVTQESGLATPLVYRATTSYDPKLRPLRTCDARLVAHEWARDDVGQHRKLSINGHQQHRQSLNDSEKLTAIEDCPIVGETTVGGTDCPSVSADTSTANCSGNVYLTQIQRDGSGLQRSVTASDPNASSAGASIESVTGQYVYSADRLKYGYSLQSVSAGTGQGVSASTSWERDLLGNSLGNMVQVDAATQSSFSSSRGSFFENGDQKAEENMLGSMLSQTFVYTPTRKVSQQTDYVGTTFHSYYDNMDRMIRHCYPDDAGGSQGEVLTRDAVTGELISVTHFTNSGPCVACDGGDCGDELGDSVTFTYMPFGAIGSKTYLEKQPDQSVFQTELNWAYDEYQRPTCFADAVATAAGSNCPPSPTVPGWSPGPEELLSYFTYWPDSDLYKRGFLMSACRGIQETMGGVPSFVTQCVDTDFYTSIDSDGACDGAAGGEGAYANLLKTRSLCSGGSCLAGTGSPVYETTYKYDGHRRTCSVESRSAQGSLILASTYQHDQYDNVIEETHQSDLDASVGGNYEVAYEYDGMMRMTSLRRSDLQDNQLELVTYEYDAASNITKRVQTITEPPPAAEAG